MDSSAPSMDDVITFISDCNDGKECSKAMFYFLYKEILMNRIMIMEAKNSRAGLEHNEKLVNDLNRLLMEKMPQK